MSDALFFVALAALFIAPFFLMPKPARPRWIVLFVGFAVVLAICEAASYLSAGLTLSQLFWKFSEINPTAAWIVLASLAAGWVLVLIHLARKLIQRKK
jgi:hypothetical protein